MKIIRDINELSKAISTAKEVGSVGFVPTMGALHTGHISLVERCKSENNCAVVSIFVNPTQFNDPKDLERYPRTEEEDFTMLEAAGCDIVFAPSVEIIYPTQDNRVFDFGGLDKYMEGAKRPGHFNGVAQVVSRLFELVTPSKSYFGEKDFQQLAIVKYMTKELGLPVEIISSPTKRAEDGLALSSRNALLSSKHRGIAPFIYKTLSNSVTKAKDMSIREVELWVSNEIGKVSDMELEYFTISNAATMSPATSWSEENGIVGCIAVRIGGIRLIDNIKYF